MDQCARPACRHAPPPHSPRVAALCGAPPAEPLAPPACPHRTRCTPLRCALRCTTSERASRATETPPLAPGRRRRSRRASSAELCSARTLRSARPRGSDVGAWRHRSAQVYPFLPHIPPRRSPGLIPSLDYSFSNNVKTGHEKEVRRRVVSRPCPLPKTDVSFSFCCCLLATWVCAPAPTSPSPAWLHAWTGLTRRAPRVLLTDSELSQPPTSSGAGLAPAGV